MTEEPKFQAPPMPPKAPAFGGPAPAFTTSAPKVEEKVEQKTESVTGIPANNFATALKISPRIFETKFMAALLGGCVLVGMLFGMVLFGGSSAPQQKIVKGLTGVVPNPDIRSNNLRRCGTVAATSPCLVFIMNHERNDKLAEDFFDEAAKLTGRAPYRVRIENQHYATTPITRGQIAVIKIPPR